MPYFVFKITESPIRLLEELGQFPSYREASVFAKGKRAGMPGATVKLIFAEDAVQAEDLLNQPREPEPLTGDDW